MQRTTLGLAALVIGVLGGILAIFKHFENHALRQQVERLRQEGAIVENYYILLQDDSRSLFYAGILIGLIGLGLGIWLLRQNRSVPPKVPEISHALPTESS